MRRRLRVRVEGDHGDGGERRPPRTSACYAPHSALYLQPEGLVHACCTTGFCAGSVTGPDRQSLREIWDGAALAEQRQFLESGRFDLGCQECEWITETGGREASLAASFDRFADGAPHRFPKLLDLALSNRCNLQCIMCNGDLSSTIRAQRERRPPLAAAYDDEFFEQLDEFLPHLERMQFKGGEPFLAPENRRIWDRLIELGHRPEITVTTNGTVLNDEVERYITELQMHPIVSVDAVSTPVLESIRVGVDGAKLWTNIDRFQELADVTGRGMTLSFCLLRSNWMELMPFLVESDRRDVNCNVIIVNQPAEHDLLRMGREHLEVVHGALVADDRQLFNAVARGERDMVLTRIRTELDSPDKFVTVGLGPRLRPIGPELQAMMVRELTEEHGVEPLVLRTSHGVVDAVDAPEWSEWLHPVSFLGRRLEDLGAVVAEVEGAVRAEVASSRYRWVGAVRVTIGDSPRARALIVYTFIDADGGSPQAIISELSAARM